MWLYSNLYSNADEYRRKTVVRGEQRNEERSALSTPAHKPRRISYALPPQLCAQPSFRLVPFFPACFPELSSLQDGSGCPVGAANVGFSAYYPGILRLLSRYLPSAPALLIVWQLGAVSLLCESAAVPLLPQLPCAHGWTAVWVRLMRRGAISCFADFLRASTSNAHLGE